MGRNQQIIVIFCIGNQRMCSHSIRILTTEDIQSGSGHSLRAESVKQRRFIYQFSASGIDEQRPRFHLFKFGTTEETAGLGIQINVNADDVR